jgi:branched-subunit amino acid transport protein
MSDFLYFGGTILVMGVVTYAIRLSMFVLHGRVQLPDWLMRALNYVPAAVLTAIIVPEMVLPNGTLDLSLGNERLLAGLVAIAVAWRTRNVIFTVIAGMGTLWLLQALSARLAAGL